MTYPASSSAATHEAAIETETNPASIPFDAHSTPASPDSAPANVRQDAIQSLESLASSGRPLAELLEEAKQLVGATNPQRVTVLATPAAYEKAHIADIEKETSGDRLDRRAKAANRLHRSGHFAEIWRRARLQIFAALGAVVTGYAFGHLVAANDLGMRFFFTVAVALGLFFVFSAFATQLNRRRSRIH